jgi:hypothetical protein
VITIAAALAETGEPIAVTIRPHALQRFMERVRPALGPEEAGAAIRALAPLASITATAPCWLARESRAPLYLVLGDVAFVLTFDAAAPERLVAVTCLVARGGPGRRRRRAPARAARRSAAPARSPRSRSAGTR